MKKLVKMLCACVLVCTVSAGCGNGQAPGNTAESADKIQIVCTTFPQYDWVQNMLGEAAGDFNLSLLAKNNTDIHNYQPSAQDMISIKEADLFIYIGGESESWVTDMMEADDGLSEHSVSLMEVLHEEGLLVETGHVHQEHDHAGEDHAHHTHDEEQHQHSHREYDEHIWLSLKNARVLCQSISDRLLALDPAKAEQVKAGTTAYLEQLEALDREYRTAIPDSAQKPLIMGDRFPFLYLAKDYDLEYYAAFVGCNAEVEVSFDTIISLAEKVDELQASYVLALDGSDQTIARTIIGSSKGGQQEILTIDSMQSVSWKDVQAGASYLDIMAANLEVLLKALG